MTDLEAKAIAENFYPIFQKVFSNEYQAPLPFSPMVMVLTAPHLKDETDYLIREADPENRVRISKGVEIVREMTAKRLGSRLDILTTAEIMKYGPALGLNGEYPEQLGAMLEVTGEPDIDFPVEAVTLINSGRRYHSHTGTQMTSYNELLKLHNSLQLRLADSSSVVLISSDYHVLRVELTAEKKLAPQIDSISVVSADTSGIFDQEVVSNLVNGEKGRIEKYIILGDIATEIQRGRIVTTPIYV